MTKIQQTSKKATPSITLTITTTTATHPPIPPSGQTIWLALRRPTTKETSEDREALDGCRRAIEAAVARYYHTTKRHADSVIIYGHIASGTRQGQVGEEEGGDSEH